MLIGWHNTLQLVKSSAKRNSNTQVQTIRGHDLHIHICSLSYWFDCSSSTLCPTLVIFTSLWHTLSQFPSPHPTTLPDNDFLSVFRNWVTNHIPCSGVIQNACMSLLPELDSCHGNITLACLNWANFIMYNILFYSIYYSCVCTHIQYADR